MLRTSKADPYGMTSRAVTYHEQDRTAWCVDCHFRRIIMDQSTKYLPVGGGAAYLNMEVGSGAIQRGKKGTYIAHADRPWDRFASPTLGKFLADYYTERGATFMFNEEVSALMGGGSVSAVSTKSNAHVEADV